MKNLLNESPMLKTWNFLTIQMQLVYIIQYISTLSFGNTGMILSQVLKLQIDKVCNFDCLFVCKGFENIEPILKILSLRYM